MSKGLPIFTLAKKTIKGWFPTSKGGNNIHIHFIGVNEEEFLYYAEYNPQIVYIERADIGDEFKEKYLLYKSPLSPVIIPYEWDGEEHKYYPDFLITLRDGKTIIVEVGDKEEKKKEKSVAKSIAAIEYCKNRGWEYWLVPSGNILSKIKKDNLIQLKSYDKKMYILNEIQDAAVNIINSQPFGISVEYIINGISSTYKKEEVEMAVYELINSAAKQGRLVFDIDNEYLNKKSIIGFLTAEQEPLTPALINLPYEEISNYQDNNDFSEPSNQEFSYFDVQDIPEQFKDEFLRRRAAVLEAISGHRNQSISAIANKFNIKRGSLYDYIGYYLKQGESGLIPYATYNGKKSYMPEEIQNIIKKLAVKKPNWTAIQIHESAELKDAIIKLSKQKNILIPLPSYWQVYRFLKKLKKDTELFIITPRERSKKGKISTLGQWINSITSPLDQVQVDAHWLDIKIVTQDKRNIAGKLWAIAMIDVKTAMIVGYSLSLKDPMEEDYMRALKCCIEPKDQITSRFGCKYSWPCSGIPRRILSDNGKIFISKRTTDVLVKRFGIIEEIAPPYAPDVKGSIEALFTWVVKRLTSRLPGFTKEREPKELRKEVLEAGVTFEDFENLFVKAIVDGYSQEWDDIRGHTRFNLWVASENEKSFMAPSWLGGNDELKLLLMKEEQSRKVDRHGISFGGRYYQNKTMLGALLSQAVNIRYDKRDISVIYVYLQDGKYYCEAYCQELLGKRLSIWEDQFLKNNIKVQKEFYNRRARSSTNDIISEVTRRKGKRLKEKEARLIEQSRQYDQNDIHIEKVKKVLSNARINENLQEEISIAPIEISNVTLKKPKIRPI